MWAGLLKKESSGNSTFWMTLLCQPPAYSLKSLWCIKTSVKCVSGPESLNASYFDNWPTLKESTQFLVICKLPGCNIKSSSISVLGLKVALDLRGCSRRQANPQKVAIGWTWRHVVSEAQGQQTPEQKRYPTTPPHGDQPRHASSCTSPWQQRPGALSIEEK